jgi:raffinose/stachyose/melibiose transport system permease protein
MKRGLTPYLFLLPALVVMATFIYLPILQGFHNSLFRWNAIDPDWTFVGFNNYRRLFGDRLFWTGLANNAVFALVSVAAQVLAALILAAVLESGLVSRRVATFFRTSLFLPSVLAVTVVGLTWMLLLRPQQGLINQVLDVVGLGFLKHAWLGTEETALWSIMGVSQWQYTGYAMILFIVAIQGIPAQLYESAVIDGANRIQQFIHITVPAVRETTLVMTTVTIIGAFKVFDIVWVMTEGGPNNASEVVGTYLYRSAFRIDEMGYASTMAMVLFVITFILTFVQLRVAGTGQEA